MLFDRSRPLTRDGRAQVRIAVGDAEEAAGARPLPQSAFCIALIGDFTGAQRGELRERAVLAFDRDDLDAAVAQLRPEIRGLAAAGSDVIRFNCMEHFHPDSLYERAGVFTALRDLKRRLADRSTAADVARAMTPGAAESVPPASLSALTSSGGLLERMLENSDTTAAAVPARPKADLDAFVRSVMAPHLVSGVTPQQAELIAATEAAIRAAMRELLHHPEFQTLERAWRAADFLARRLDTNARLRLYLIDVSRAELDDDLTREPRDTALYQLLDRAASELPDSSRWSVLCGLYAFGTEAADAARIATLARVARSLGAPWISAATPAQLGVDSFATLLEREDAPPPATPDWRTLRQSSEARWVGLAGPRFLLRAPYGDQGESLDSFAFEEDDGGWENYLWGNPAVLCALLLGQAFTESDWQMRPGVPNVVDGLPLHLYRRGGEVISVPCAETLLTEDAADEMLELGIMPVVSPAGLDEVRLIRFQSLAEPLSALAGPWSR